MTEIQKTQAIRLYGDVLFIAPYLIYLGVRKKISDLDALILMGIGVATLSYNLRNYIRQRRQT